MRFLFLGPKEKESESTGCVRATGHEEHYVEHLTSDSETLASARSCTRAHGLANVISTRRYLGRHAWLGSKRDKRPSKQGGQKKHTVLLSGGGQKKERKVVIE